MSNYDYEVSATGQHRSGSVLPWVLLTMVAVVAGVGMFAFNTQKEQAMAAMDKYKAEAESQRKLRQSVEQSKEDLQKQLDTLTKAKDDMEHDKNEMQLKLDQANQQLALQQKEAADTSKKGAKGGKHTIVVVKGGHRRH